MKSAAFAVLAFGLILITAGLAYGLTGVRVDNGTSCGSAFAVADVVNDFGDDQVDTSREQCDASRADTLHGALALLLGGIVGTVVGGVVLLAPGVFEARPAASGS